MPAHSAGIGSAPTVTIPGVELVQVGLWAASTGLTDVKAEHLASMVAASHDPGVDKAPLKIGHTDPRFAAIADGEPAYGWPTNLRVEDRPELDAQQKPTGRMVPTLIGDLAGVPAKLAEIMPHAFRRRSVEIGWGYRTAAGTKYPAILSGLALLGVQPPAVKTLADVVALYSAGPTLGASLAVSSFAFGAAPPPATLTGLLAAAATAAAELEARVRATPAPLGNTDPTPPPAPGGTMPVDEARIRTILGVTAEADIEAAVAQLVAGSLVQPPAPAAAAVAPATATTPAAAAAAAAPAAPAVAPAPAAAAPAAVIPAAPAAPPAAAAPLAPAAQAPTAPAAGAGETPLPAGMVVISEGILNELRQGAQAGIVAAGALEDQAVERELVGAFRQGKLSAAELPQWRELLRGPGKVQAKAALAAASQRYPSSIELGTPAALAAGIDDAQYDAWESEVFGLPLATATTGA